jgi:hypothetical protein
MILRDMLHTEAAPLFNTMELLLHGGVIVCFTDMYLWEARYRA